MRCGIPVVSGYSGQDQSPQRLLQEIQRIGYPVILKASYGGGGRVAVLFCSHAQGMRIVENDTSIDRVIEMCSSEAKRFFGDGSLILEK